MASPPTQQAAQDACPRSIPLSAPTRCTTRGSGPACLGQTGPTIPQLGSPSESRLTPTVWRPLATSRFTTSSTEFFFLGGGGGGVQVAALGRQRRECAFSRRARDSMVLDDSACVP
ncbi:hypothetical protein ACFFX0_25350 [Citricoccus parietis]|uniref:Uncharacterized protein n=1 Tax=Citricoccus parietis TaxID=592307 RepID=A0ABV5G5W6_9MICC